MRTVEVNLAVKVKALEADTDDDVRRWLENHVRDISSDEIESVRGQVPSTSNKPPLRLRIKHNLWPVVGDATLMGMYAEAQYADHRGENKFDHKRVVLEIEQTSYRYRRDNGGPAEMIVTEFVPMCIINDVLSFQRHGIDLKVEVIDIHNEPNFDRD